MRSLKDLLDDFLYIWMGVRGGRRVSKAEGKIIGADEQDVYQDEDEPIKYHEQMSKS
jgi:hypothetical protein